MSSSTCSTSRLIRFQLLLLSLPIVIFLVCQQGDAARTASDRQTTGQHWAANNNNNNNNNLKRRRQHNSRPCFICPGSSMLISPDRYDDADVAYNGVDAQQHADGAVRMPEPVVRPCLYSNKYQKGKMRTQVVLGPQPGTVLDQGTHRVVVKVAYQLDSDNNITDRSLAPRHHAYCRYTLQVMPSSLAAEEESREPVRLCRPPPSPEHGRVACSSVGDDVSITTCRYTCDEGYVTPKTDRHLVHQDWDCYSDPGTSRPPKCIKFESPVPLDPSQCSGLNLTVPDFDPVQLPLPKFQTPAVNSAVYVTCDLNVIQAATFNGSSISPTVFKRLCVAKNNETDAKFNCNYDIQIHLDPTSGRTVMFAEFRFQLGRLLPTSSYPTSWCDDRAVVERIMETAKTGLLQSNAEPCQTANCSLLTAQCHREISNNKSSGAVLNLAWTVAASYQPFSYDDYFYEGSEVPEGEMLIEKIKAETEVLIQTNLDFRKKLETAGGDLLDKTFQLAKLDLICPLPGYVVNASTNNCQKCPPNTFQQKSVCQLCPERTYQDRAGQTECRPCPNRPSVTVKSSEHYNSRCRPSRPDHASIVALTKLPNRKSSSSTIQTRQLSSSASGKLGKIAAAHTQTSPNHNDKFTSSSKYKNRRHHQHPVSHQQPYQLATGRSAVSRNSFTTPAINDTAGIVDDDEDPCSPNPCLAGGTCFRSTRYADNNRIVSSFKCSCRVGTKGIHCETPYCPTLYCLNGGTCHVNRQVKGNLGRDLLNCTCPLGFTGSRCEHRRQSNNNNHVKIRHNRHHSLHHQPNGSVNLNGDVTRANKTIGASSRGAAGLMGTYCASNPCKNGGRCVDNSHAAPGYFTCFCPPNFQGELCDFTPCPTSVARTSCPMSFHYPLTSAGRSRKRHSCWIQTSTGRRQCYWPPHPPSPASKSSSPAAPLYEIA